MKKFNAGPIIENFLKRPRKVSVESPKLKAFGDKLAKAMVESLNRIDDKKDKK